MGDTLMTCDTCSAARRLDFNGCMFEMGLALRLRSSDGMRQSS